MPVRPALGGLLAAALLALPVLASPEARAGRGGVEQLVPFDALRVGTHTDWLIVAYDLPAAAWSTLSRADDLTLWVTVDGGYGPVTGDLTYRILLERRKARVSVPLPRAFTVETATLWVTGEGPRGRDVDGLRLGSVAGAALELDVVAGPRARATGFEVFGSFPLDRDGRIRVTDPGPRRGRPRATDDAPPITVRVDPATPTVPPAQPTAPAVPPAQPAVPAPPTCPPIDQARLVEACDRALTGASDLPACVATGRTACTDPIPVVEACDRATTRGSDLLSCLEHALAAGPGRAPAPVVEACDRATTRSTDLVSCLDAALAAPFEPTGIVEACDRATTTGTDLAACLAAAARSPEAPVGVIEQCDRTTTTGVDLAACITATLP